MFVKNFDRIYQNISALQIAPLAQIFWFATSHIQVKKIWTAPHPF
jgi:hypothetical protein